MFTTEFTGRVRMDARSPVLSAVAILVIAVGARGGAVFAGSVYIYRGSFNLPIPAEPLDTRGWMDDALIQVPDHFTIYDLDVGISLTHTSVFDLQIFIQSPAGTRQCLNMYNFRQFFHGADYTQTIFDDEAEIPIEQGSPPFTGRFKPKTPYYLGVFDDQDAFGLWQLQIHDVFYYDTGNLNSFELRIAAPEPATITLLAFGTALMTLLNRPRRR